MLRLNRFDNEYLNKELENIFSTISKTSTRNNYVEEKSESPLQEITEISLEEEINDDLKNKSYIQQLAQKEKIKAIFNKRLEIQRIHKERKSSLENIVNRLQIKKRKDRLDFSKETLASQFLTINESYRTKVEDLSGTLGLAQEKSNFFKISPGFIENKIDLNGVTNKMRFRHKVNKETNDFNSSEDSQLSDRIGSPKSNFLYLKSPSNVNRNKSLRLNHLNLQSVEKYKFKKFDHFQLKRKYYNPMFKKRENEREKNSHNFLRKIITTKDSSPFYTLKPKYEIFFLDNSHLAGKILISKPLLGQINPNLDFGSLGQKLDQLKYKNLEKEELEYIEDVEKFEDPSEFRMTHYNFSLLLKEALIPSKRVKTEKFIEESLAQEKVMEYLGFIDSSHKVKPPPRAKGKNRTITFLNGAFRYYDKPESHMEKKNFQQQVDLELDHDNQKLTLSDFSNNIERLYMFKQKIEARGIDRTRKKDQRLLQHYMSQMEETINIILNMKPEILRTGIYQTINHKVGLLMKTVDHFQGLYVGKYYILEVILFLLKEYLYCKWGLPDDDDNNTLENQEKTGKKIMKWGERREANREPYYFKKSIERLKLYINKKGKGSRKSRRSEMRRGSRRESRRATIIAELAPKIEIKHIPEIKEEEDEN